MDSRLRGNDGGVCGHKLTLGGGASILNYCRTRSISHSLEGVLTLSLTTLHVRRLRLAAQLLDARATVGAADVVRRVGAVQAQDTMAEALAVRVRTSGVTRAGVKSERVDKRSVVRTWAMRGTLHLLPAEDVHWILRLVGPTMVRKARRRHIELGLTDEVYSRAVAVLRRALGDGVPLTRRQIAELWVGHGLPSEGQAVPHLLSRASMEGVICFGPTVRGTAAHVLLDSWLGGTQSGVADPNAELARRYVSAYAPTTPEDYGAWSGLPMGDARSAFESISGELILVDVDGKPNWIPAARAHLLDETARISSPCVKMLGAFDPYLLGYRVRELGIGADLLRRVHPGGGIIRPVILVDGRAVATWTRKSAGRKLTITVDPFQPLSRETRAGIDREVRDIGRSLDVEAAWGGE